MNRVSHKDIDYSAEYGAGGAYLWKGEPFTGIAYTTYQNGQLRSESEYKYGLGWGTSRSWYPDGTLRAESTLYRDALHGLSRTWSPPGQLRREIVAEFGIKVSEREWDEQGVLVKDYQIKEEDGNYKNLQKWRNIIKVDEDLEL